MVNIPLNGEHRSQTTADLCEGKSQMSTQGRPPAEADCEAELSIIRRTYAKHVLANAEVDDARVEAAFAAVRREDFLGPGPWPMLRWPSRYVPTPSDDPIYLY